jgi:hypothetical protein
MSSPSQQESVGNLADRIRLLLSGTLGAFPFDFGQRWRTRSPLFGAVFTAISYAIVFCGLPWIIFRDHGPLFWSSVWASCYFVFASAIARATSASVLKVIEKNILPELSDTATAAIDVDLTRRFDTTKVSVVAILIALVAACVSGIVLHYDVTRHCPAESSASLWQIDWVCCGYFILYFTAARATYVARFYGTFATHLKIDSDRLYALDPARSRQVAHIASVAQRVLLFWFGIVCAVATLYPLFYHCLPWFVIFVVPVASFFSVGFGTVVFLNSEEDIRSVVKKLSRATLNSLEKEIEDLFSRRSTLDESQWERMRVSMTSRDQLIATGSYRSAVFSWFNILGPLALPLIPAIVEAWKKRFG